MSEAKKPEMSEEEIDANIAGSFPASDPPAWTLGTDHGTASDGKRDEASTATSLNRLEGDTDSETPETETISTPGP